MRLFLVVALVAFVVGFAWLVRRCPGDARRQTAIIQASAYKMYAIPVLLGANRTRHQPEIDLRSDITQSLHLLAQIAGESDDSRFNITKRKAFEAERDAVKAKLKTYSTVEVRP